MFLSRLVCDRKSPQVHRLLRDTYRTHAFVARAFPKDAPSRVLFRIEPSRYRESQPVELLVQSATNPSWEHVRTELGSACRVEWREFLPQFATGRILRFRLRANPVVKRDGKRLGLVGDESQIAWLSRKGDEAGFVVKPENVASMDEGFSRAVKREAKEAHEIRIRTVLFEGLLEVTDSAEFARTVASGVGPAKGLGCGLLSLARA